MRSKKESVVIVGAGAMGCLFGGLLAEAGHAVTFITKEADTAARIVTSGILIETPAGARRVGGLAAVCAYTPLRAADLALVCVKAPATPAVALHAREFIGPETLVVTLQNGLGNLEALMAHLPPRQVAAAVTSTGALLFGPGHVRQAGQGETVLGCPDGGDAARVAAVCARLSAAGLPARSAKSVTGMLWTKLMANVGINALAALTGLRNGEIFASPDAAPVAGAAVAEAALVAAAAGVVLDVTDPVAHARRVAAMTADNEASMLQDVRAERPTEIDAINGAISRRGREVGVPTPVNDVLTSLVRLRQAGYEGHCTG